MGFLPICCYVHTTIWMHRVDANKTRREKARWEQQKNAARYSEQILEATPNKTTAVQPLAFHLTNDPRMTNKTCCALTEKQDGLSAKFSYGRFHKDVRVLVDQQEFIDINSVRTLDAI